jgi:hypothetical protein
MKKLLPIIFLTQILLLSCNTTKENKTESKKQTSEKIIVENKKEVKEIKGKTDLNQIKKYAKLILKNEINPSDNEETFECIEQILIKNQSELEFYFDVFRIIVKKSDGALSEMVGATIMDFIKFNPDFFIIQYSQFSAEEKNRFIDYLSYELYLSETKIDDYFLEVNSTIKLKTEPKIKQLNSIKELTKIKFGNY